MVTWKNFPFIDMGLFWDRSGRLEFYFHQENNQILKNTNKDTN